MTTETILEIPLADLRESPFNPRRTFNQAALDELAASIEAEGRIHEPLLVRPIVPPLFDGVENATAGHEIVFGHRRLRAAAIAGLATAPCMVRTMSDEEARRAQIAENLQRADVHPIEEAEGFQALIDSHGESADRIAEQIGKSRSYVYGRLKLLAACPEIRKACLAGEIGSETALLIARLRTAKLQEKALGYIKGKYINMEDGGSKSYRQIRDLLNERFTLELKSAMFDTEDEMLVPSAGHCVRCPKRSGNAPEFEDIAEPRKPGSHRYHDRNDGWLKRTGADICTDPDCFDAKKKAHLAREAAKLAEKGKVMVTGNAARNAISADGEIKGAYVPLAKVKDALKKAKSDVAIVTIQDPRTGKTHQAVKVEDAKAAGVKVAAAKKANSPHDYEADRQKRAAEENRKETAAKAETDVHLAIFDHVRAAAATRPRDTVDMQLIAQCVWSGVDYQDQKSLAKLHGVATSEAMQKRIGQMGAADLAMFLLDCALIANVFVNPWHSKKPEALLDTARRYGVDVGAIRAKVTGEPVKAAAAKKKHPKGKAPEDVDLLSELPHDEHDEQLEDSEA